MVKKRRTRKKKTSARKKVVKKTHKKEITQTASEVKVERILVENFVSLQKVMVNLSVKLDNLASKISKLLELFELSAKALVEKDFDLEKSTKTEKNTDKIIEKIDKLADQNKLIARGLTLIHERPSESTMYGQTPNQNINPKINYEPPAANMGGYQKSISSQDKARNLPTR